MAGIPELTVNLGQLAKHHNRIPDQDFINARFDSEHAAMTENLLVILSTPRSGSTLLCDMLRQHEVCISHEYFQPYQYMPLLADRWGCIKGNVIDTHAYSAALRRFRTYTNGWLGINLHGEHLRIFLHFEELFSDLKAHFVHIVRGDLVAQAVSYEIAAQTKQWTNNFEFTREPEYSYDGILKKLQRIQQQNVLIRAFVVARNIRPTTVLYEDLARNPESVLNSIPGIKVEALNFRRVKMERQSTTRNERWATRFACEYEAGKPATSQSSKQSTFSSVKLRLRRLGKRLGC